MHELAVTKGLVKLAAVECENNGINNPTKVFAEIGSLTTYITDSVMFYYEILKKEYPVIENTILHIEVVPGKLRCNSCCTESSITDQYMLLCPKCGSTDTKILQGKEFRLKSIDYEG